MSTPFCDRNITINLYKFLTYALGNFERIPIEPEDGMIIAALDEQEVYCHVEFPDDENGLKKPMLWWIKPWRESYDKWVKQKAKSAAERHEANLFVENRQLLARAMARKFGLPIEYCIGAASKMAKGKNVVAAENLGVKIEV